MAITETNDELLAGARASQDTVIFFGSGPVAATCLKLLAKRIPIEAVVTKPRPAHHKGDVPVIDVATELGIPFHTTASKQDLNKLFESKNKGSRLGVVIDYGIIISKEVIDSFELGILNSHFSLLPELRGADPITFSILSGQKTTGVSLMLINEKMDEGELISQDSFVIPEDITTPLLTEKLIKLSDELIAEVLLPYLGGQIAPWPQDPTITPTYSRKLTKQDGQIDWTKSAEQIEREIRAFAEWPKSYTKLAGIDVIITSARIIDDRGNAGEHKITDKQLTVFCGDKALKINKIKPSGKPEMDIAAFLNGYTHLL